MSASFIANLDDLGDFVVDCASELASRELELFVNEVGPKIIASIESDAEYALDLYSKSLDQEKLRPQDPGSADRIASLEKAIAVLKKFPGIMSFSTRNGKIVVDYSLPAIARALNFGTKDILKLDPTGRAVAIFKQEADKHSMKLERETQLY